MMQVQCIYCIPILKRTCLSLIIYKKEGERANTTKTNAYSNDNIVTDPYTERETMTNAVYSVKYTYIHWPHCFYSLACCIQYISARREASAAASRSISRHSDMYYIHHVDFRSATDDFQACGPLAATARSRVKKASFQNMRC